MAARLDGERDYWDYHGVEEHVLGFGVSSQMHILLAQYDTFSPLLPSYAPCRLKVFSARSPDGNPRTVKTAKATVPIINASELLHRSKYGGLEPCCVNDDSHAGRAISLHKSFKDTRSPLFQKIDHYLRKPLQKIRMGKGRPFWGL